MVCVSIRDYKFPWTLFKLFTNHVFPVNTRFFACEMSQFKLWIVVTGFICLGKAFQIDSTFEGETEGSETCSKLEVIDLENLSIVRLAQSSLFGKWVSQRCEIRTGPEFISRSYSFHHNYTFHLVVVYYKDQSCSHSMYAISAHGSFNFQPVAGLELDFELSDVVIVIHDPNVAKNLSIRVKQSCPESNFKFFRPNTEYMIYKLPKRSHLSRYIAPYSNLNDNWYRSNEYQHPKIKNTLDTGSDNRCVLHTLRISFDELQYMRIYKHLSGNNFKTELYLSRSRTIKHVIHPFQLPLALYNESLRCHFCDSIARSTHMHLPIFSEKIRLPLVINGEWISESCETSQEFGAIRKYNVSEPIFELFSMKRLRLEEETGSWEEETRYYSNYKCTTLVAMHQAFGLYFEGNSSKIVNGATEMDFETRKSYLIALDQNFVNRILVDPVCGNHNWQIGLRKEISRLGCSNVQLSIPIKRNIARRDVDESGSYLLYLGEYDSTRNRPTAYNFPLVQCMTKTKLKFSTANRETLDSASFSSSMTGLVIVGIILHLTF